MDNQGIISELGRYGPLFVRNWVSRVPPRLNILVFKSIEQGTAFLNHNLLDILLFKYFKPGTAFLDPNLLEMLVFKYTKPGTAFLDPNLRDILVFKINQNLLDKLVF